MDDPWKSPRGDEAGEASSGKGPPGSRPSSFATFAPGRKIGPFEIALLVREDDAGSAWLASEKTAAGTERLVALRTAAPTLGADERFCALLRQEVKLATGVAHPNVAQVLGVGDETGAIPSGPRSESLFVASEWVDGESFADLRAAASAKRVRIPQAIALRILADACAGLHAAHLLRDRSGGLLNVVHGDVSPRSIVIAASGEAKVIDLGFMKARARHAGGANHAWSQDGRSPPGLRIDRHADVWGIGAILADVLGEYADVPASSRSGAAVPSLVSALVVRARSLDPMERFATAAEMQGAIEGAMMSLGIATSHATVGAFAKGLVGDRTRARAEALRASRAKARVVLSIPTPPVDSVPATVQSVRAAGDGEFERSSARSTPDAESEQSSARSTPDAESEQSSARSTAEAAESSESRILKPPRLPRVMPPREMRPPPVIVRRESRGDTGSAVSHTPVCDTLAHPVARANRGRRAFFAAGSALALVGLAAGAYRAIRPRGRVAVAVTTPVEVVGPPLVAPPPAPAAAPATISHCPAGMVEVTVAEALPPGAPSAPFCLDSAPVTTEAYKGCSDDGDCKRAATENRWAGITAKEQAADDPLCRERDPRAHAKEPVNCVDRDMAAVYCKAHGLRLPTEAEAAFVTRDAGGRPTGRTPGAFSEWSQRPDEPATTRSYAIGFRCARTR
jgi:eukaryotic-like serine/threonine-protein kinase